MSRLVKLLAVVLLALCAAFAQDSAPTPPAAPTAQPKRKRADSAEQRLKRVNKRLNLSDDQKEKILPIFKDEEKQISDVEGDNALDDKQKHKKMRQIRVASRTQMDSILTPEQREKMPPVRHGGGRHGKPNSGTAAPSASDQ